MIDEYLTNTINRLMYSGRGRSLQFNGRAFKWNYDAFKDQGSFLNKTSTCTIVPVAFYVIGPA